jgi:hypothetical protein
VTITCAIASFIAWYNTKNYYHKITLVEDIEKIDKALSEIMKSKDAYNQILSIFGDNRGTSKETIKRKFKKIKLCLQNIETELPQKFNNIFDLCREPIGYIDKVIGGQVECKNSNNFEKLQSNINTIQKDLKTQRDALRGIK